ncbi:hypothetical protein B0H13DRAFT_2286235 [Mycena leptocephala]|nr:hypothetical protein B0H13DRAFT_2286235 [Mycena leptocephala]
MVRFQPEPLSLNARAISLTSLNPTQRSHLPRASHLWTIALLSLAVHDSTLAWLHLTLRFIFIFTSCPLAHRTAADLTHFMQVTFRPTISIQVLPDYIQLRDLLHLTDCRSGGPQNFQILVTSNSGILILRARLPNSRFIRSRCQNYRRARQDLELDFGIKHRNAETMTDASRLNLCYTSRRTAPMTVRCGRLLAQVHTLKASLDVEQLDFGLVQVGALEPLAYGQPQLGFNFDSISLHEPLVSHSKLTREPPPVHSQSYINFIYVIYIAYRLGYQFGFLDWLRFSAFGPESSGLNRFDVTPFLRYLDDSHLINSPLSGVEVTAKSYQAKKRKYKAELRELSAQAVVNYKVHRVYTEVVEVEVMEVEVQASGSDGVTDAPQTRRDAFRIWQANNSIVRLPPSRAISFFRSTTTPSGFFALSAVSTVLASRSLLSGSTVMAFSVLVRIVRLWHSNLYKGNVHMTVPGRTVINLLRCARVKQRLIAEASGELGQRAASGGLDWMEGSTRAQSGSGVGRLEYCSNPSGGRVGAEARWDRQMNERGRYACTDTHLRLCAVEAPPPTPYKSAPQRPPTSPPTAPPPSPYPEKKARVGRVTPLARKGVRMRESVAHGVDILAERDELEGAARFGFVTPPRGLGTQHTQPVLLHDPPAGVVDAQRGGGGDARAEDYCPWVSSSGGTCGGDAAAELKKELETEGKEGTEEPEAERDGLSGGDGVGEWDGEGWWVWRVRIVSVLVLIDPASIAVGDKMGGVRIC